MKPTRSGTKWVHVSCALWIPEVGRGGVGVALGPSHGEVGLNRAQSPDGRALGKEGDGLHEMVDLRCLAWEEFRQQPTGNFTLGLRQNSVVVYMGKWDFEPLGIQMEGVRAGQKSSS